MLNIGYLYEIESLRFEFKRPLVNRPWRSPTLAFFRKSESVWLFRRECSRASKIEHFYLRKNFNFRILSFAISLRSNDKFSKISRSLLPWKKAEAKACSQCDFQYSWFPQPRNTCAALARPRLKPKISFKTSFRTFLLLDWSSEHCELNQHHRGSRTLCLNYPLSSFTMTEEHFCISLEKFQDNIYQPFVNSFLIQKE